MRRDAQDNRRRLLDVATRLVAERGPQVPLSQVADQAGVGPGTLYRHFPTRRDLLVAVFDERIDELCRWTAPRDDEPDAGARLRGWLGAFIDHATTDQGLAETIDMATTSSGHDCAVRIEAVADELLAAAKAQGVVTAPIGADDLIRLAIAISTASDGIPQAERLVSVLWNGLTGPVDND